MIMTLYQKNLCSLLAAGRTQLIKRKKKQGRAIAKWKDKNLHEMAKYGSRHQDSTSTQC
jgi:hypothetical protein